MITATPTALQRVLRMSLISQIAIGLVLGVALALIAPGATKSVALLGDLFIAALKAVAPILVFVLVAALWMWWRAKSVRSFVPQATTRS